MTLGPQGRNLQFHFKMKCLVAAEVATFQLHNYYAWSFTLIANIKETNVWRMAPWN